MTNPLNGNTQSQRWLRDYGGFKLPHGAGEWAQQNESVNANTHKKTKYRQRKAQPFFLTVKHIWIRWRHACTGWTVIHIQRSNTVTNEPERLKFFSQDAFHLVTRRLVKTSGVWLCSHICPRKPSGRRRIRFLWVCKGESTHELSRDVQPCWRPVAFCRQSWITLTEAVKLQGRPAFVV